MTRGERTVMVFGMGSGKNADDKRGIADGSRDPESTQVIPSDAEQTQRLNINDSTEVLPVAEPVAQPVPPLAPTVAQPVVEPVAGSAWSECGAADSGAAEVAAAEFGAAEFGAAEFGAAGPVNGATVAAAPSGGGRATPKRRRGGLIAAIVAGVVLLAIGIAYAVDLFVTSGKVERGTHVAGVAIGGMTPEQATEVLNAQAKPAFAQPISISVHGQAVTVKPAEIGLGVDIAGAVREVGLRSANPIARVSSFFRKTDLPLKATVNNEVLTGYLAGLAKQTDIAAVEGALARTGTTVKATKPVIGQSLDVMATANQITKAWTDQGPKGLAGYAAQVTAHPVRVSPEGLAKAEAQAKAILTGPVTIKLFEGQATLPLETIAEHTSISPDAADGFTVAVNTAAIKAAFTEQINGTQAQPKDAVISMTPDGPKIQPSVTGRKVNWAATDQALAAAIKGPERTWAVAYETAEPALTTAQAEALGIKEVIGEWTTGGFSYASGQNVKTVAAKVNGALIGPNKTFSLNKFTGPRGTAQGYIASGIIKDGKPDTAIGGGISQFATTLYNAAYFAGMGDVTHKPHSFYISRYPEGREATVFEGVIDLAFSNDYPTAAMIQTIWTPSKITVRIWGTKTVAVESVRGARFNHTPPKVVTIPAGQECRGSNGSGGWSIVDTRIIRDLAGNEIRREDFKTVYTGETKVICAQPPEPAPAPGG